MRDELRALQEPVPHELRVRRRGVALHVCAGTEMEYIYRLAQLRNAITMELNAIPVHDDHGDGEGAQGSAPLRTAAADGEGDDDEPFDDGGEDALGPHDGMAVWDDGSGPAGSFGGGIAGGLRPQEFEGRMGP